MAVVHAIRVDRGVEIFAPLVAALLEKGYRVGWLELRAPPALDLPLENALDAGAFRVVAVGAGRSLAAKSMKGSPVLEDVLRESFKGCRLVFVQGESRLPQLRAAAGQWELVTPEGAVRRLSSAEFVRAVGRPSLHK